MDEGEPELQERALAGDEAFPWVKHLQDRRNPASRGLSARADALTPLRQLSHEALSPELGTPSCRPSAARWAEALHDAAALTLECTGCTGCVYLNPRAAFVLMKFRRWADLTRCLWEAQLKRAQDEERKADAARRRFEEERGRLDERERQLDARRKELEEQKKEQERLARDEAMKQKAEADALEAERRELLTWRKELQHQEIQLTGREENARAGFVAQQASALAELRQRKTELEAVLQTLPAGLS